MIKVELFQKQQDFFVYSDDEALSWLAKSATTYSYGTLLGQQTVHIAIINSVKS